MSVCKFLFSSKTANPEEIKLSGNLLPDQQWVLTLLGLRENIYCQNMYTDNRFVFGDQSLRKDKHFCGMIVGSCGPDYHLIVRYLLGLTLNLKLDALILNN